MNNQHQTVSTIPQIESLLSHPINNPHRQEVLLWLVRHGKTMFNTVDRVQGWSDTPLVQEGIDVVSRLANGLRNVDFSAVYSSDSGRARQTAELIIQQNINPQHIVQTDWRLRELNFGNYEGERDALLKSTIVEEFNITPEQRKQYSRPSKFADQVAYLSEKYELANGSWQAENYATLSARLKNALFDIVEKAIAKHDHTNNILIVSHAVSIWTIWEMINDLAGYQGNGIINASVMQIRYTSTGQFILECANDTSWLSI